MHRPTLRRPRHHLVLVLAAVAAMGTNCVAPAGLEGSVTRIDDTTVCIDTDAPEERCADVDLLEDAPLAVGDCVRVHLRQPSGDIHRIEDC